LFLPSLLLYFLTPSITRIYSITPLSPPLLSKPYDPGNCLPPSASDPPPHPTPSSTRLNVNVNPRFPPSLPTSIDDHLGIHSTLGSFISPFGSPEGRNGVRVRSDGRDSKGLTLDSFAFPPPSLLRPTSIDLTAITYFTSLSSPSPSLSSNPTRPAKPSPSSPSNAAPFLSTSTSTSPPLSHQPRLSADSPLERVTTETTDFDERCSRRSFTEICPRLSGLLMLR